MRLRTPAPTRVDTREDGGLFISLRCGVFFVAFSTFHIVYFVTFVVRK